MIRFSCKCGFEFRLADDRVGQTEQCPRCGLLVDAPSTDDLAWVEADGTIGIDDGGDDAPPPPRSTLAEMYRTFGKHKVDADGNEIDMRSNVERLRHVGDDPGDRASMDVQGYRPQRITPRYDPLTGERIVPLGLKDETPQPVLPVGQIVDDDEILQVVEVPPTPSRGPRARRPVAVEPLPVEPLPVEPLPVVPVAPLRRSASARQLGYAVGDAARATTVGSLAIDLLTRPANLIVLLFVGGFYVLAHLLAYPLDVLGYLVGFGPLVAQLVNLPLVAIAAHYGCVVEDTGPDAIDELPRPLRNFSVGDDVFAPATRVILAVALCFGPATVVANVTGMAAPTAVAATLSLAAAGAFAFPAVVLTLLVGSTVLNLTPSRLLGVARQCGGQYVGSVLLGGLAIAGTAGVVLGPATLPPLAVVRVFAVTGRLAVAVPAMCATMYVSHLFAWHLGLLYRSHHDAFPWVGQRHVRTPRGNRPLPVR